MEFILSTDLSVIPQKIDFNFEELKSVISSKVEFYKNLVVTENGIKEAKSDRAKLNKFKEAIETKRKEIKSLCLEPYNQFEKKCKEITAIIAEPILAVDAQIKAFEDAEKESKYNNLQKYFNDNAKELSKIVTLDRILNPKWANKGEKLIDLTQEIWNKLDRIRSDLKTITDFNSPYDLQIKDVYLRTLDLSEAISEQTRLVEQDERLKEIGHRRKAENTEISAIPVTVAAVCENNSEPEQNQQEQQIEGIFWVKGTVSQMIALRNFIKSAGLQFEVVKQEGKENEH
jgi:hypothetical protein